MAADRQYLGAQYANPENIIKDNSHDGYALPTVAVYLLWHGQHNPAEEKLLQRMIDCWGEWFNGKLTFHA